LGIGSGELDVDNSRALIYPRAIVSGASARVLSSRVAANVSTGVVRLLVLSSLLLGLLISGGPRASG